MAIEGKEIQLLTIPWIKVLKKSLNLKILVISSSKFYDPRKKPIIFSNKSRNHPMTAKIMWTILENIDLMVVIEKFQADTGQ